MEVHHHTHTARKKWKHYFWEFFMLFLAVLAGFFVENQREHYIEKQRAKAFAASLLVDIKKDTAALNNVMDFSNKKIAGMNNFIELLHSPRSTWNDSVLYVHSNYFTRVNPFFSSQGTYEQIKNSGSLRYFPTELISLLNSYDLYSKRADERDVLDTKLILDEMLPYAGKRLNLEVFNDIIYGYPITHVRYNKIKDEDIDEFINLCVVSRRHRERSVMEYQQLWDYGHKIMKFLEETYHLE